MVEVDGFPPGKLQDQEVGEPVLKSVKFTQWPGQKVVESAEKPAAGGGGKVEMR